MRVWIDQNLCTGAGTCEEMAPQVFTMLDDGLAYVYDAYGIRHPGGPAGVVYVPPGSEDVVVQVAEICPGECIHIA